MQVKKDTLKKAHEHRRAALLASVDHAASLRRAGLPNRKERREQEQETRRENRREERKRIRESKAVAAKNKTAVTA